MGTLVMMNRGTDAQPGDARLTWDPKNADEVAASRKMFDDLRKKGFLAYRMETEGKGGMITAFDPEVGKIIMAPPLVGG